MRVLNGRGIVVRRARTFGGIAVNTSLSCFTVRLGKKGRQRRNVSRCHRGFLWTPSPAPGGQVRQLRLRSTLTPPCSEGSAVTFVSSPGDVQLTRSPIPGRCRSPGASAKGDVRTALGKAAEARFENSFEEGSMDNGCLISGPNPGYPVPLVRSYLLMLENAVAVPALVQ